MEVMLTSKFLSSCPSEALPSPWSQASAVLRNFMTVFAVMQNSTQALDSFLPSPLIHYFLLFVAQGGTVFLEAKTKAEEPTSEELAAI